MKLPDSRRIWAVIIAIAMMLSIAPAAATADAVDDGDFAVASVAEPTLSERFIDLKTPVCFEELPEPEEATDPIDPAEPEPLLDAEAAEEPLDAAEPGEPAEAESLPEQPTEPDEPDAVDYDDAARSDETEPDEPTDDAQTGEADPVLTEPIDDSENDGITEPDADAETDPIDVTVTIVGHRETLVYDGTAHTVAGYDVAISDPRYTEADFVFNGTAAIEGAWAREYPMGLSEDQFENLKPDFATVTFQVTDGGLTITRRPVTVKSGSATKVYDGTALENRDYVILGDGFAANEMPIVLVIGSVTDVGKVKNRIIVSAQNAPKGSLINTINLDNYEITLDEGTLEVTPKTVTVTAEDREKKYGAKDPEFTAVVKGLLDGDAVQYTITREEGEKAGDYAITPRGEVLQGNYKLVFESGTLHIAKRTQKPKERFTLAWFSDAKIAADGARADALEAMVDWTVENANAKNIVGLFGTGSLVGAFNDTKTEAAGVSILSKVRTARRDLRYYGAAGAIDVNGDEMNYVPYANRGVRGASVRYHGGEVWVQPLFETGVIAVGIGYHKLAETEEEQNAQQRWIRYVNERIASLCDGRSCTILFVNDYVDETGKLTPFGELVESEVVAKNPSVRMILSSCKHGAAHTEATYGERTVNVLAFNYAEDEANGLGYLRLLTFDPKTHTVEVSTYSPVSDRTAFDTAAPETDTFTMENAF